jgi:hypothetical protein
LAEFPLLVGGGGKSAPAVAEINPSNATHPENIPEKLLNIMIGLHEGLHRFEVGGSWLGELAI